MPDNYTNTDNSVPGGPNAQKVQTGAAIEPDYIKSPVEGSPDQPLRGQSPDQGTGRGPGFSSAQEPGNGETVSGGAAGPNATMGAWGASEYDKNKGHTWTHPHATQHEEV